MSAEVLAFLTRTEEPTLSGEAVCLACKHEWVAVAPVGTGELECPECHCWKGVYRSFVRKGELTWECNCGCQLFCASPSEVYCANCGTVQTFP